MPETNLKITVTTDSSRLQQLIDRLNAGEITLAEFRKEMAAMRKEVIVGSKAHMDYKNVLEQVQEQTLTYTGKVRESYFSTGEALRVQEAGERGLTETIKSARKERRLYMFAVRESLEAVSSVVGAQSGLSKAMTEGASATFGIKFALDAMGGSLTRIALPIALAIGAFTVLKDLFGNTADEAKKATEEMEDQNKTITELIDNLHKLGKISDVEQKNLLQQQIRALESANKETMTVVKPVAISTPTGMTVDLQKMDILKLSELERTKNLNAIVALKLKIKELDKEEIETEKDYNDQLQTNYQLQVALGDISLEKDKKKIEKEITEEVAKRKELLVTGINPQSRIILDMDGKILKSRLELKTVEENIQKKKDETTKKENEAFDKQISLIKEQASAHITDNTIAIEKLTILKEQTKSLDEQAKIENSIQNLKNTQISLIENMAHAGIISTDDAIKKLTILKGQAKTLEEQAKIELAIKNIGGIDIKKTEEGLSDLQYQFQVGLISGEAFKDALVEIEKEFIRLGDPQKAKQVRKLMESTLTLTNVLVKTGVLDPLISGFQKVNSVIDATQEGFGLAKMKFSDFANSVATDIARIIVKMGEMAVMATIFSLIPGVGPLFGGAGSFSGIFQSLMGKSTGGDITRGQPYIVGEKGAELFIPEVRGTIIPHHQLFSPQKAFAQTTIPTFSPQKVFAQTTTLNQLLNLEMSAKLDKMITAIESQKVIIHGQDLVLVNAKASNARKNRIM